MFRNACRLLRHCRDVRHDLDGDLGGLRCGLLGLGSAAVAHVAGRLEQAGQRPVVYDFVLGMSTMSAQGAGVAVSGGSELLPLRGGRQQLVRAAAVACCRAGGGRLPSDSGGAGCCTCGCRCGSVRSACASAAPAGAQRPTWYFVIGLPAVGGR